MAIDISKQSDGSVKFDYGGSSTPTYITDLEYVTVQESTIKNSDGSIRQQFITISTSAGIFEIPYLQLATINGVARPGTIALSVTALATTVFNVSGGGGAGTVTSVAGVSPVAGNVPLTATDVGATPLQPEIATYVVNQTAKSSYVNSTQLDALNDFIIDGRKNGWLPFVKIFNPAIGTNLAGGMVNLLYTNGVPSSMVNHNLTEADFNPNIGFSVGTLGGTGVEKWLDPGITPSALGLSGSNICFAYAQFDNSVNGSTNSGTLIADNPVSGNALFAIGGSQSSVAGRNYTNNAVGGKRTLLVNITSAIAYTGWLNAVYCNDSTSATSATATLDTPITIYKNTAFAVARYSTGNVGHFLIANSMSKVQADALSKALFTLSEKLGRIPTIGGVTGAFGDSITAGQSVTAATDRYSDVVAAATGTIPYNVGVPSSEMIKTNVTAVGGFQRYTNITKVFNTMIIMYGTNDEGLGDSNPAGTTATIADYGTKLETVITDFKGRGAKIVVCSPPYRADQTSAKQILYVDRAALAASNKNVVFVNVYDAMVDTGTPAALMNADGLHLNTLGHALASRLILAALQNRIYRDFTFDFPSIAAGATADIVVPRLYGARVGNNVELSQPAAPTAGIIYQQFVNANDQVTVRAVNITTGAIDPASQVMRVTVILTI